jgi:hypothetical protein
MAWKTESDRVTGACPDDSPNRLGLPDHQRNVWALLRDLPRLVTDGQGDRNQSAPRKVRLILIRPGIGCSPSLRVGTP